jgi:DNA-binding PadR family transcriptional regulator
MDINVYLAIRGLFHTKWDPAVLDLLDERPDRFLALSRRVRASIDQELAEGSVNRALNRLTDLGYVWSRLQQVRGQQVAVYELTERGERALATYRALIAAYEQVDQDRGAA